MTFVKGSIPTTGQARLAAEAIDTQLGEIANHTRSPGKIHVKAIAELVLFAQHAADTIDDVQSTYNVWRDAHHAPPLPNADVTLAQAIEGAFDRMDRRLDALPVPPTHKAYVCTGCGKQVDDLNREQLQHRSGRIPTCCPDRNFVPWDAPEAERMRRIDAAHRELDAVEKTWSKLWAAEEVGNTRTYFSGVFENIRHARRTR